MGVVVVLAMAGQSQAAGGLPYCRDPDYDLIQHCDCPESNDIGEAQVEVMKNGTENLCLCDCGLVMGSECTNTGECEKGNQCAAPSSLDLMEDKTKGICVDACKTTKCAQFSKCVSQVGCECETYACTSKYERPINCNRRMASGQYLTNTFYNDCERVNRNCLLLRDGAFMEEVWVLDTY